MSITFFTIFRDFLRADRKKQNFFAGMEAVSGTYTLLGDVYAKKRMETDRILGDPIGNGRPGCWSADTKRHGNLWTDSSSAASGAAGMVVSGGMDDFVCLDGRWRRAGVSTAGIADEGSGTQSDGCPVGGEFLLAASVFQCPGLWICSSVAATAAGACGVDDLRIPEGIAPGSPAADPLHRMAPLRHLPKHRRVVFEPMNCSLSLSLMVAVVRQRL